jgi:predicted anti-sigma-YlaC factor YlaD
MKHQSFEDWVLSEEQLTSSERVNLDEHLQMCDECRDLQDGLELAESWLRQAPEIGPAPGFSARWSLRLAAEQRRLQRRQSLIVLGFVVGAVALLGGSLLFVLWPLLHMPDLLIWSWAVRLTSYLAAAVQVNEFVDGLLAALPRGVLLLGMILALGLASELAVLWLVSLRLLTQPRRVKA